MDRLDQIPCSKSFSNAEPTLSVCSQLNLLNADWHSKIAFLFKKETDMCLPRISPNMTISDNSQILSFFHLHQIESRIITSLALPIQPGHDLLSLSTRISLSLETLSLSKNLLSLKTFSLSERFREITEISEHVHFFNIIHVLGPRGSRLFEEKKNPSLGMRNVYLPYLPYSCTKVPLDADTFYCR